MRAHLDELIDAGEFTRRHTSATEADRRHMLAVIGEASVDSLLDHTLPPVIRMSGKLELGDSRSPESVHGELRQLAARNVARTSLIGMGYYGTITPPVVVRNVLENPAWYTAYTPYQPEISQGRLEALLNFQTMVAELTGFDLANASLLDEATAAAEAMTMARRLSKSDSNRFVVHHDTHPQTIAVLATRAEPVGIELVVGDVDDDCRRLLRRVVQPARRRAVRSPTGPRRSTRSTKPAVWPSWPPICWPARSPCHPHSSAPTSPSVRRSASACRWVSVVRTQPSSPCGEAAARALPGRLVGVSTDTEGRPALRLALQTREQHIRREKATSNICTAQVLLANIAGFYAAWHGPEGLRRIAERIHRLTSMAADGLRSADLTLVNDTWFDTLQVHCNAPAVLSRAAAAGIDLRFVDEHTIGFSFDETSTPSTVGNVLAAVFARSTTPRPPIPRPTACPRRRTDEFLTQTVFSRYHTEHEMLRYLRRLADKDLALDRTMIPLGSCTMKLNATVEMEPLTWPGLGRHASVHPRRVDGRDPRDDRPARRRCCWRSPATTRSACSPMPAARASSPACWRSAPTTAAAATRAGTCA